ncbi:MAG: phosphogluconate dehydrogenase (NAD(+)-dependent, decarboxylating) [Planctomycetota bacterium]|jgi:6-phosphogluconate dehydrogenase
MKIGIVGLGKMGGNMTRRWLRGGHEVVAHDRDPDAVRTASDAGAIGVDNLDALVAALPAPRAVWLMLPAGAVTDSVVEDLGARLEAGDCIVDGGNTFYHDDLRRAARLAERGVHYVDQGTSGGVWGLEEGYCLMVGGDAEVIRRLRPAFETLAPAADRGWGRVGPVGSGHFVKMIHNGIEYGLMQAYAEGFELMRAKSDFQLDLHQVAELWRHGSVVRSWLLDLTARALAEDPELPGIDDWVADSGEGRWTVMESIDLNVPAPVIALSLQARFASRQEQSYGAKLLAAMRQQFGGHAVRPDPAATSPAAR